MATASGAAAQAPSFTPLGGPPHGATRSTAVGVSGDGSVVTGSAHFALGQSGAIRWTRDGGIVFLPDVLGSPGLVEAKAASADGSLIAGVRPVAGSPVDTEAFRWTESAGTVRMGSLPGPTVLEAKSGAYDVSADGTTIVGFSSSATGVQAFRWTAATGMVGLTRAGGFETSDARGVSADGNVVIGSNYANFGASRQAYRWAPFIGMRPLRPLAGGLVQRGISRVR